MANLLDRILDTARAQRDLEVGHSRTGDGQHQRCRVSEVADPRDRSSTIRKVGDLVQPLPDVLEFLLSVLDVVQQPDLHNRNVVLGRGLHTVHLAVSSDGLLDLARDQLLNFVRRDTLPRGDCKRDAHRYVGIFPLGHVHVPEHTPCQSCEQCYPGNLPVIDKESCDITTAVGVFSFH